MWGFQSYSSFKIDKHTVPDGYILGWGNTGLNIHLGGLLHNQWNYLTGKSWEKSMVKVYVPYYHGVPFGPGI
jgi:hypothetical protein